MNLSSVLSLFEIIIGERKDRESQFFATANFQLFECTPEMQQAFRSKSRVERVEHYCFCVGFLKELMLSNDMLRKSWPAANDIEPKTMEATVTRNSNRLRGWAKDSFSLDVDRREIVVGSDRLNLRNYFIRDSKNFAKRAVIFEALTGNMSVQVLRVGFQESDHATARQLLKKVMDEC